MTEIVVMQTIAPRMKSTMLFTTRSSSDSFDGTSRELRTRRVSLPV